jgi:hypothetical protein
MYTVSPYSITGTEFIIHERSHFYAVCLYISHDDYETDIITNKASGVKSEKLVHNEPTDVRKVLRNSECHMSHLTNNHIPEDTETSVVTYASFLI